MKVLLVTDIHGETENLEKILEKEDYEAILCGGDLSDANKFDSYSDNLEEVLETFNVKEKLVKAVPGNMDPEEECVRALIDRSMNLHKNIASVGSFEAVGFGGGKTPFGTPFEPEGDEIRETLELLFDRMTSNTRVAVIHQPPGNTSLDVVDGDHVGSEEVRELVEEKDFDLVLTGHIHESSGVDSLNGTTVVNPGPVMEGKFAIARLSNGEFEVETKEL